MTTQDYYTLEQYIDDPSLLTSFVDEHPTNFANIFFLEFEKLFLGLQNIIRNNKYHGEITPEKITFNLKTKKLKFIDNGKSLDVTKLKRDFDKNNGTQIFSLKKYRPMACFFGNKNIFRYFSSLTSADRPKFNKYVYNKFYDKLPNNKPVSSTLLLATLDKLITNIDNLFNTTNFGDYKHFIEKNQKDPEKIFNEIKTTYVGNDFSKINANYKIFLENIIHGIDIYGLSLTIAEFIKTVYGEYPFDEKMYNKLINFLSMITSDESIHKRISYNIDHLIYNLKSNITSNMSVHLDEDIPFIKNTNINNQYELKSIDIQLFNGPSKKNYINYNHRVMRVFTKNNIFNQLNLSPKNYAKIRKIMNDAKYILIDKDAYYKIKYNSYCTDDREINPYTTRCVKKCDYDHYRYFHDDIFICKKYSKKNRNSRSSKSKGKSKKYRERCSSGYERNPFTKRCTRKCSKGYVRNLKFNCISEKDVL